MAPVAAAAPSPDKHRGALKVRYKVSVDVGNDYDVRVDEDEDCPDGYRRSYVNDEICFRG